MSARPPILSVVIVTHNSRDALAASLPALLAELRDRDELVVVDNASRDGTAEAASRLAPAATVIEAGANLGFAAGCNLGADASSGDLLCLLNPDAIPAPGWRDALERPIVEGRGWAAWQGLVTADDGRRVNTRGGVVHFTGIAWAGGAGEPIAAAASDDAPITSSGSAGAGVAEPGFVSGACLAIPRLAYLEAGGLPAEFFLYHEDVDLSLRLRLAGGRLGVEPAARVDHAYEFEKGPAKWRYLERNRWATVLRTYPRALLAALAPALVATELALIAISLVGGWLPQKLAAWGDTVRALPRLLAERRRIQATRTVDAGEFAAALGADLDSPYLGAARRSRLLRAGLRGYWALVLAALDGRRG